MYQVAIKRSDHYTVLNSNVIYCDKEVAVSVLKAASQGSMLGEGEYVLLEYAPFKVYRMEGDKLINITTKKEKV